MNYNGLNNSPLNNKSSSPDSIKRRLNLHVKRRLLVQGSSSPSSTTSTTKAISSSPSYINPSATYANVPLITSTRTAEKFKKIKISKKQQPRPIHFTNEIAAGKKRCAIVKKPVVVIKATEENEQNKRKVINTQENETCSDQLDNGKITNTTTSAATTTSIERCDLKGINSPDILSMVLNEKKTSLLNDPEIVKFLLKINNNIIHR